MNDRVAILKKSLAPWSDAKGERRRRSARAMASDRTLQTLVADLVAARTAVCLTQAEVAARMGTTKSVISRLESGKRTRPTLRTIQSYALAVGASVEIRIRWRGPDN